MLYFFGLSIILKCKKISLTQKYYIISDRDRELLHCDVTNPKDAGKLVSEGEMENFTFYVYFN